MTDIPQEWVEKAAQALDDSRLPYGTHSDRWTDVQWQREFWREAAETALAAVLPDVTAERDALAATVERVRALADEWSQHRSEDQGYMDGLQDAAYDLRAELDDNTEAAMADARDPKPCPRCGVTCTYDGWDHVHPDGMGIGSCDRFVVFYKFSYEVIDQDTRVLVATGTDEEQMTAVAEQFNAVMAKGEHEHIWKYGSAMDGDYRKCQICGEVVDVDPEEDRTKFRTSLENEDRHERIKRLVDENKPILDKFEESDRNQEDL